MIAKKRLSSEVVVHPRKRQPLRMSSSARRMPIFMAASSGAGKSRFQGRLLAPQDILNGYPLVILDPHGQTIDNLLDKLRRLPATIPEEVLRRLWRRVRYVDMSGKMGYLILMMTNFWL